MAKNSDILSDSDLTERDKRILNNNKNFFNRNKKYIDQMLDIINGNSRISIRSIEYFVTNYSKKNNIVYKIKINGIITEFCVYLEYAKQMDCFQKKYLDPFCRQRKIFYNYKDLDTGETIVFQSSIGQLNFFQWVIKHKILHYLQLHSDVINADMRKTFRQSKQNKIKESNAIAEISEPEQKNTNNEIDETICSSQTINSICISSQNSITSTETKSKPKRRQLSQNIYNNGILKYKYGMKLAFD